MSTATELLRRALEELIEQDGTIRSEFCGLKTWYSPPIIEDIRIFLAAEPEAEPVGYVYTDFESGIKQGAIDDHSLENGTPLYTRPEPSRKPMTEEEMDVGFNPYRMRWLADDQYFVAGVRWAEKHHGIDENPSEIINNQEVDKPEKNT